MRPRKTPPPATAARSPNGAGRRTRISAIGTDIWTSIRAMCRAHHVLVVVSNSTQPRWRSGSRPPIAYQSQRWGAGRTIGSVVACSAGSVMRPGCSCSTTVTIPWCPNNVSAPRVGAPINGAAGEFRVTPPGSGDRGRRAVLLAGGLGERLLGGRDHLGERLVQGHQLLDRHAEALDDAGGDLLGLLAQRPALVGQR